jgi:APA family basic amino acid/polyamine antiporter
VIFGNIGTVVIALLIMISTFGCNNGLILAGARVYYTMAKDGLFFKPASNLNKFAVPQWALWFQCLIACAWSVSGKYGQLLDMISFVVVIFYVMTILGIFILRKNGQIWNGHINLLVILYYRLYILLWDLLFALY